MSENVKTAEEIREEFSKYLKQQMAAQKITAKELSSAVNISQKRISELRSNPSCKSTAMSSQEIKEMDIVRRYIENASCIKTPDGKCFYHIANGFFNKLVRDSDLLKSGLSREEIADVLGKDQTDLFKGASGFKLNDMIYTTKEQYCILNKLYRRISIEAENYSAFANEYKAYGNFLKMIFWRGLYSGENDTCDIFCGAAVDCIERCIPDHSDKIILPLKNAVEDIVREYWVDLADFGYRCKNDTNRLNTAAELITDILEELYWFFDLRGTEQEKRRVSCLKMIALKIPVTEKSPDYFKFIGEKLDIWRQKQIAYPLHYLRTYPDIRLKLAKDFLNTICTCPLITWDSRHELERNACCTYRYVSLDVKKQKEYFGRMFPLHQAIVMENPYAFIPIKETDKPFMYCGYKYMDIYRQIPSCNKCSVIKRLESVPTCSINSSGFKIAAACYNMMNVKTDTDRRRVNKEQKEYSRMFERYIHMGSYGYVNLVRLIAYRLKFTSHEWYVWTLIENCFHYNYDEKFLKDHGIEVQDFDGAFKRYRYGKKVYYSAGEAMLNFAFQNYLDMYTKQLNCMNDVGYESYTNGPADEFGYPKTQIQEAET